MLSLHGTAQPLTPEAAPLLSQTQMHPHTDTHLYHLLDTTLPRQKHCHTDRSLPQFLGLAQQVRVPDHQQGLLKGKHPR